MARSGKVIGTSAILFVIGAAILAAAVRTEIGAATAQMDEAKAAQKVQQAYAVAKEAQAAATAPTGGGAPGALDDDEDRTDRARSEEGMKFHKEAAKREKAFQGVGLEAGIKIWRIEKFELDAVDEDTYGQFHVGDSYIVLQTRIDDESEKRIHDIYFWIGKDSSADEYGTAAYKTVELDDLFDGEPTQHRESQTTGESEQFKELFPNKLGGHKLEYLEGGVDSGFRHVVPDTFQPELYQVRRFKGKVTVLPNPLKTSSLNPDDCFVLNAEGGIYILEGPGSDSFEKFRANIEAEEIESKRAQKGIKATRDIDDAFWKALGSGDKPDWASKAA